MHHHRSMLSIIFPLRRLLTASIVADSAGAAASNVSSCGAELTETNRRVIENFVQRFYVDRDVRGAFEAYVSATGYIQHNPNMPDGREAAIAMLEPKFQDRVAIFEPLRVIVDGPLAVVHLRARPSPQGATAAVIDMFRLEGGQIVEHWDVIQPMPENPRSEHPLF